MATPINSDNNAVETVSLRLTGVHGDGEKVNDVYVFGSLLDCTEHIIFFGGDVQDYTDNMQEHVDNKLYTSWSTENTAKLIGKKFSSSLVFIIKPTRMHLQTYADYSNFYKTDDGSSPTHCSDYGAIRHLSLLCASALKEVYSAVGKEIPSRLPIKLLGFSKGCCVLNQLVFELHLLEDHPVLKQFMERVKAFYWLDGGHAGGETNTWVTDDDPLKRLASLDCYIFIHITPYQVRDPMRKWIGPQEFQFCQKLAGYGAKVLEQFHFDHEPASLTNHFKVLEIF